MSHFTVVVRVPEDKARYEDTFEQTLSSMLIPYKEYNGEKELLADFIEFHDETDERLKEYQEKSVDRVVLEDGTSYFTWDSRFSNPNWTYTSPPYVPKHVYPETSKTVAIPFKELYSSFEEFCEDWHGDQPNERGRYGYWRNPNSKWDWFSVGGRWSGYFPLDSFALAEHSKIFRGLQEIDGVYYADVCRIRHIDFALVKEKSRAKMEEFWQDWLRLLSGHEFPVFEGPGDAAAEMGLLKFIGDSQELPEGFDLVLPNKGSSGKFFAVKEVSREDLDKYEDFFSPIAGYARLDESGWQSKGEMGWFGFSNDSPDSCSSHYGSTMDFYKSGNQNDWVVLVDCHI